MSRPGDRGSCRFFHPISLSFSGFVRLPVEQTLCWFSRSVIVRNKFDANPWQLTLVAQIPLSNRSIIGHFPERLPVVGVGQQGRYTPTKELTPGTI